MDFEWDEDKRAANIAKHALDFIDASTIWHSPVLDPISERIVEGERRHTAVGIIAGSEMLAAVVYTVREDIIRIISARRARRNERKSYKDHFGRGT